METGKECQSEVSYREKIIRNTKRSAAAAAAVRYRRSLTDGEPLAAGTFLNARYLMRKIIGQGISSNVWECVDKEKRELVAVKIIHDTEAFNEFAYKEVEYNELLGNIDESQMHFPRMLEVFEHQNHLCIVFERLGLRMCDVQKINNNYPLPLSLVRDVGRQLLESVELLHRSRVIHTDLKPDNILFVSQKHVEIPVSKTAKGLIKGMEYHYLLPASNAIKVIDFGSLCDEKEACNTTITARAYRAPEVILGLGWSFPSDIWSVGCILAELCGGRIIFNTKDDMEHLARMEALLGRFPSHMLKRTKYTDAAKYVKKGMLNWPHGATSPQSIKRIEQAHPLQSDKMLGRYCDSEDFIELVLHLLKLDPADRPTAKEALNHPFFTRDSLN